MARTALARAIPLSPWMQRLFIPRALHTLYEQVETHTDVPFWRALLREMGVSYAVVEGDAESLARPGPTVVVANHPFGMLDAAIVCDLLRQRRDDVRVLTNYLIAAIPRLKEICLSVNPFGGPAAKATNRAALAAASRCLQRGGMLVVFPAGEVASYQMRARRVVDAPWYPTAARLAIENQASVIPLYIAGHNSLPFHALGLVHPALRTVRLGHELLKQCGQKIELRVRAPVSHATLAACGSPQEATALLRQRCLSRR